MATLVLTAVGTAVGGPIGGAIGAVVGQSIDRAVFAPKARQGPRLDDLKVQTSTYGARIPRLFGRVRVAGQVIWSTDLIETRAKVSNGKGRGSTETYSYAASFAVALSARAIIRVERIWADGKLLRGAAGDLKTEAVLRVHPGDEDAAVDPLIASAEGVGATPAYRGIAYVVFEALQLASFGTRIPSLSFEVVADKDQVGVGTVIGELARVPVVDAGPAIDGLAATGDDARAVAEALSPAIPLLCRAEAGVAVVRFAPVSVAALAEGDLGAHAGEWGEAARLAVDTAPLDTIATALTLSHADGARDYQPGLQRARREGPGLREERVALPVTLGGAAARRLAEDALARRQVERVTATATVGWSRLTLRPGDLVIVDGRRWRIAALAFERMVVRLSLIRWTGGTVSLPETAIDSGRALAEIDVPPGATTLAVIDLPAPDDLPATRARVAVFAAGASPGWRRTPLLASVDGGTSFAAVGSSALPATMGTAVGALPPARCDVVDRAHSLDVTLLGTHMMLADAEDAALLGGANRAMVGGELIQFGRAEPLGETRWRLSELWRGRGATEDAAGDHRAGERFVLLDGDAALLLPPELAVPGVIVIATGIGDEAPWPTADCATVGQATRPLSPVELVYERGTGGDIAIRWTRRSRGGWRWSDGVDAPLGEEREAYRVTRRAGGGAPITVDVDAPSWTYTTAMRAADAAAASPVTIMVGQIGAGGVSAPAILTLPAIH